MAVVAINRAGCPSGLSPPNEDESVKDLRAFVRHDKTGRDSVELIVEGAKCAGCIRKIEGGLLTLPGVAEARLNLSTGRLRVSWARGLLDPAQIGDALTGLGYRATPFDAELAQRRVDTEGRFLLRCLAVAGFAAMNIMMFSAPIWFGEDMGDGTRTALHWISALIAIPCALYAAQPFFRSAWRVLKARRANMDVPISLAVVLTLLTSIAETMQQGEHAYFDGITMLLFFLLIGRYLDHSVRERARTAARDLLALQAVTATKLSAGDVQETVSARQIEVGDRLLLAIGDRAPCDAVVESGASDLDCSMLTGETLPVAVRPGDAILAGTINLSHKLTVRSKARADESAVAELARLIEVGEQGRTQFARLADRAATLYVPVVHTLALLTFVGWLAGPAALRSLGFEFADVGPRIALTNAVAVLIITCPCALGLAVPAVQVVATGGLFKRGVLVRSGDALERLAQVDTVVFDKTGTLTLGRPRLSSSPCSATLMAAASLARVSRHPLSRAVVEAAGPGVACEDAMETPGAGVEGTIEGRKARLGRRGFASTHSASDDGALELWFAIGDNAPFRFTFEDALRPDAVETVAALKARGFDVQMLSGDRAAAVEIAAEAVDVDNWRAGVTPAEKTARVQALRALGRRVLMIGDGLNDAAALAAANASASPGTAVEASQAAADIVFQGGRLMAVVEAIDVAKAARARSLENLRFSALYNLIAAPAAAAGLLTPLIAAAAMSGSSLVVSLNAVRLQWEARR
ncbi:MAG: heavy metal translocating P-type ATPase [Hyphomonadaceae bacterium]